MSRLRRRLSRWAVGRQFCRLDCWKRSRTGCGLHSWLLRGTCRRALCWCGRDLYVCQAIGAIGHANSNANDGVVNKIPFSVRADFDDERL